jgi:hypothetical protein
MIVNGELKKELNGRGLFKVTFSLNIPGGCE